MRKKKNLWSGVSILIVAVLVITAFIRGNAQAWLLAAAFVIWAVWATYYFLVPYIKEELHKREAKRIRKKCEKQDAAFDRFIIPEVSDPVEQVLLRHANYRISAYLQSVYPNATWEWREEFPERIIAKGGTGRVKLFGVDGYNFADVTFDQNGGINCALVNIVPLKQPNAPHPSVSDTEDTAEAPAAMPKQPDPVDPQVWYEVQGRKVLEALIMLLSLPPTSLRPYSDFITAAFATRRRPIYSGVVQIGLKRVDNGSNTYSVATFRLVQRFEGNDLLQIKQYADGFREQIKAMNQQRAMEAELGNNEPICDAVDSSYHSTDDGEHFCITEAPIDGDHEDLPM